MLELNDDPVYNKIREMLKTSISFKEEEFLDFTLDDIFKGNLYQMSFFLFNLCEEFEIEEPIDAIEKDVSHLTVKDLIEFVS